MGLVAYGRLHGYSLASIRKLASIFLHLPLSMSHPSLSSELTKNDQLIKSIQISSAYLTGMKIELGGI